MKNINKLLIANRSEIAIRVMRAAIEQGIRTVAVYAAEDKLSLHRFKADESYLIGKGLGPISAYLSIEEMIRIAKETGADAIHPGYGFLAENPEFAEACIANNIIFIGPHPEVMRSLGNKLQARNIAVAAGVPVMPATDSLPLDETKILDAADEIGYPVMLKASWGGGGRGMRIIENRESLLEQVNAGRREAKTAFGRDEVYLEKLVRRAKHLEVQILADQHGNIVHLFERDCSVQRRNQKIVERAPAAFLSESQRTEICNSAIRLCEYAKYSNAGTIEFLMDMDDNKIYFIEVNPRVQVEHTVTEQVTGIDIVGAQIKIAQGHIVGDVQSSGVPKQQDIVLHGHALQCRVTTEDPEQNFVPDYGRISAYRGATGFGIRLDGGTAYSGAVITRYYDSLLEKVTAWGQTPLGAASRMKRALAEFRIRGVATNLTFLENVIAHPDFLNDKITTRFIDSTPDLFDFPIRQNRANRLLRYIADVTVNGNTSVTGRPKPLENALKPKIPEIENPSIPAGTKQLLDEMGPEKFSKWMLDQKRVLITDTTMRDAHQSLLATRVRTHDMVQIADSYARGLPNLFSMECWGGATFDVAMRFLDEDPWDRLHLLRQKMPNLLLQMLLRASNAVGYANYPDNVVKHFVDRAAENGIDLFRVFDALNWADNMKVAIEAVLQTDKLCEAAICYTGDLFSKTRSKYNLDYYLQLGMELKTHGAHVIGIKDMAGLCRPEAARILVKALKEETGLPIHFHTHDTSGIAAATLIAAAEVGVDAIDLAMDSLSGMTSQPNLGSVIYALKDTDRAPELDQDVIRSISDYWEGVRSQYRAFEPDLRAGASEVYLHEMPGGQFTNLKEQARSLGLAEKWHEVASMYALVNEMLGDIVKVTPTSKVVGDMALMMVSGNLSPEDVLNREKIISFPDSVISMLRGDLGQPPGGWPKELQHKVLQNEQPYTQRPGALLEPLDLQAERQKLINLLGREISEEELASYLMYPKVFLDYCQKNKQFGRLDGVSTPVYFYGMQPGDEIAVDIERGKTLVIRLMAVGEADDTGEREVFFELNGHPRVIRVSDKQCVPTALPNEKADISNSNHIAAPMPGMVATIAVKEGNEIEAGDVLLTLEAMKMESTIHAPTNGKVKRIVVNAGKQVDAKDLLVELAT